MTMIRLISAEHQGLRGKFDLEGGMVVGNIRSRTALRLIREWAGLRRTEIEANWASMKQGRPFERIAPLD